jgi:hypothetical protein
VLKSRNCGELLPADAGQTVVLAGWVHTRRDQGGIVFIDLRDASGQTFATIASPLLHPWTFPIFDRSGQQRAEIAKKWAGMTEEMLTEAQRFKIDFMNYDWPLAHRAVVLGTALSIDFDSFEWRGRRRNALDFTLSS